MSKVVLGLNKMAVTEEVNFGKLFVAKMTNNANFPNLTAETQTVSDKTDALENANKDVSASLKTYQEKLMVRDNVETNFRAAATKLAGKVEDACDGDPAALTSAGLSLKAPNTPIGPLPQPQSLAATAGDLDQTVTLNWDRVRGAKSYEVQRATDPNAGWTHVCSCTRSSVTVNSMASGTRYWFRVAAVGSAGTGPWSDPATKIAP